MQLFAPELGFGAATEHVMGVVGLIGAVATWDEQRTVARATGLPAVPATPNIAEAAEHAHDTRANFMVAAGKHRGVPGFLNTEWARPERTPDGN